MRKAMRFTLLLVLTLLACTSHHYPTQLVVADSLCAVNPDSALRILKQMEDTMSSAGRADRMYYELLKADAMNKAYVDMTTDSILKEVADYYDRHGSANEQMRAHYLLGCAYRDMGEAPMALQCYQDAVDKADTTDTECDFSLLSRLHSQMSELFHRQNLPQNEISEIRKAYHFALMDADTILALRSYEHLGNAYFMLHMPDSTLYYCHLAAHYYKQMGDTASANSALAPVIYIYLKQGDYEKAERYLNELEKKSNIFDARQGKSATYYNYRGMLCLGRKDYIEAKRSLYEALRNSRHINALDFTYQNLCTLYRMEGNADSLAKYSMLYCEANDSSVSIMSTESVQRMQSLYDYSRNQEQANKAQSEKEKIKTHYYLLTLAFLASLFGTFFIIYYIRSKKNKIIHQKIKEIELLTLTLSRLQTQDDLTSLLSSEVLLRLRHFAAKGKKADVSDLSAMRTVVNRYLPQFMQKLCNMDYEPTIKETNLCILVRIGFQPSEIATLLNMTPQAISNLRARLNERMFKATGGAREFNQRIKNLS